MSEETFENSPEHDEWIEETGGRDEDYNYYYQAWHRRILIEDNQE